MNSLQPSLAPESPQDPAEIIPFIHPGADGPRVLQLPEDVLRGVQADLGELQGHRHAAELAFLDIQPELVDRIDALEPNLSGVTKRDVRQQVLDREKRYFTGVYAAALNLADKHDGPIAIISDIDHTITHYEKDTARPAFPLVVRELALPLGDRLQLGLLSSRPLDSLQSELSQPTYTAGVSQLLKPEFIVGFHDLERSGDLPGDDPAARLAAAKDVLEPDAVREGSVDTTTPHYAKLMVLQRLMQQHPDHAFLHVDDFPLADMIRHDSSRVQGLRVKDAILDSLLAPYPATVTTIEPPAAEQRLAA